MNIVTEKEEKILVLLARYKFLTISQMGKLGLVKEGQKTNYLNSLLREFRKRRKPKIACIEFKGTYKFDKREYVYYLTKHGEQTLVKNLGINIDEIKSPGSTSIFYDRDYNHRKAYIDTQIQIYRHIEEDGGKIDFFDNYFDSDKLNNSKSFSAKTKVKAGNFFLIPDGIFLVRDVQNNLSLYVIEMHLGKDLERAMDQITNHVNLLISGKISEKYTLNMGWKILYVFDLEATCLRVEEKFKSLVDRNFWKYFEFKNTMNLDEIFT